MLLWLFVCIIIWFTFNCQWENSMGCSKRKTINVWCFWKFWRCNLWYAFWKNWHYYLWRYVGCFSPASRQNMLVFDGGNMVACGGDIVFRSERWKPVVCFYDLDINSIRQKNTTWRNDHRHLEKECYVRKLFFRNIYKWLQSPQAVHLSDVDLDHERALQIPVVQSWEWINTSIKGRNKNKM
mgnify:CR=1 FL=1